MTTQTVPSAPADKPRTAPPLRLFMTVLHLAALGVVGGGVIGVLAALFGTGVGLLFVLGIGIVFLVGLVYALYGVGWFEVVRVRGLYGLDVADLQPRRRRAPGFGGWIRSLGRQSIDGRMWRALANFAIACIFGALVIRLFWGMVWSAIYSFTPLFAGGETIAPFGNLIDAGWAPLFGILGVVAAAAGIIGLALLHRTISRALIVPNREAELTERVRTTSAQREGAVRAADVERTRIERDLHDGVQPRLVSVGMTLGLAQQKIDNDPTAAKELISEAHTSTKAAITELRQLARGIHASVLDDRGLDAALSALASRSHIPVHLDVRMDGRCSRDAEAAVYFSIAESLTNAAKHSRASECRVVVRLREGNVLWARVEDNGMGGAQVQPGGGLDGISNRVLAAGGTFRIDSPQGGPTSLEVSVPCAS
ncbi:sensor histidine kinase [Microbacterium aerolatum]|uniref:histidine kinase n=1 Tax=Microbacterium aerolatum TaxID=153731 RepID=A0A511AE33_9MICO|nr:sensor histidine kinase [Microbacterium aerolatum]GEK86425.1 two-component sensor histidine kinase [Microbacterium aerolatum]GGB22744.1 two-component sensor histidine kinase [Microbacterium aerolatum]